MTQYKYLFSFFSLFLCSQSFRYTLFFLNHLIFLISPYLRICIYLSISIHHCVVCVSAFARARARVCVWISFYTSLFFYLLSYMLLYPLFKYPFIFFYSRAVLYFFFHPPSRSHSFRLYLPLYLFFFLFISALMSSVD